MSVEHVEERVMESPAPVEPPLVQQQDRCDRCGGQAYVKTRHPLGRHDEAGPETADLLWCGHHFRANEEALTPLVVLDERDKLTAPVVSSY